MRVHPWSNGRQTYFVVEAEEWSYPASIFLLFVGRVHDCIRGLARNNRPILADS